MDMPKNGKRFRVTVELEMDVIDRNDVDQQLHFALSEDPGSSKNAIENVLLARDMIEKYRIVHAEELTPPHTVRWIVTEGNDPEFCEDGEFGVLIDGVAYLYYKHPDPEPCSADVKYRIISKREFGEVIRKPGTEDWE